MRKKLNRMTHTTKDTKYKAMILQPNNPTESSASREEGGKWGGRGEGSVRWKTTTNVV